MKCWQAIVVVCLCACPSFAENFLVLPFFPDIKSNNVEWVGESISEAIREALAAEGALTLGRDAREEAYRRLSVKAYSRLTKATVIRIAESIDADQVIFGQFEILPAEGSAAQDSKSKRTIRITAETLDLRKAHRGPGYIETGALEDLARLQNHLAWQTLSYVLPDRGISEQQFRERQPVVRLDAIESYIRGLLATAPDQKMKYLLQAVRLEPTYSSANFEIGRMYFQKRTYRQAADALQKVSSTDLHSREATFLLGLSRYNLGEFQAAEQAFQSVAQQVPLSEVLNNLGAAQCRQNRPAALDNFQKALEGDNSDPAYHFNVGYALFLRGEYDQAADRFRAVLDRNPGDADATTMLGRCLKKAPQKAAAKSEGFERLKEKYEESAYWQLKAVLERKK